MPRNAAEPDPTIIGITEDDPDGNHWIDTAVIAIDGPTLSIAFTNGTTVAMDHAELASRIQELRHVA